MSNRRKPTGLRAALAAKKVRVEHYDIPIEDYDTAKAAADNYHRLKLAAEWAENDPTDNGEAAKAAAKAKVEKDRCNVTVSFRGLTESEFDALVTEHPPSEDDAKLGEQWNTDTFPYALIAASIVDADEELTVEEWKTMLGNWPRADSAAFRHAVLMANLREFSEGIPKD